jgi:hypothetical protein
MTRCDKSLIAWLILAIIVVLPPSALAEDRWDFSVEAFGGRSYPENEDIKIQCGGCAPDFNGTADGVKRSDSDSWGGRVTAWYLPRKYEWQPQIGLGLDWTRFNPNVPAQQTGGTGFIAIPGMVIAGFNWTQQDFNVDIVTLNLMFRYPLGATPSLPQGRLSPYIGVGVGVQRAFLTDHATGFRGADYAAAYEVVTGLKFFLFRHLAVFGEFKRTSAEHDFQYNNLKPLDFSERHNITSNHLLAGVAVHF